MLKVSVIVPVYNTKKYLKRCIEALINQTLSDIELIFIDDGSTDGSSEILDEYACRYSCIKVIHKKNGGQASARNIGIKLAEGAYIGFADSDDMVDISMFEKMYNCAVETKSDMVECRFNYLEETDKGLRKLSPRGEIRAYKTNKEMLINPQVSPWNKLYKREVLMHEEINFPEGLIYEDTSFFMKTVPFIQKSAYIDEPLVSYFYRPDSTMGANKYLRVENIFDVLDDAIIFYKKNNLYEEYKDELEYFCSKIVLCSSLFRIGRIKDKKLQKKLYNKSFAYLKHNFPCYKTNKYVNGKKGLYMKIVRRWNCRIPAIIFGKVFKG